MDQIYDVIVLGGGAAGYTAAMYAVRAGHSVLVIEKMSVGGQLATTDIVENYPGFPDGIDGFTLGMQMQKGAERFGAQTHYGEVLSVRLSEKIKTIVTDSETFGAKTVIVATGAMPAELGLPMEKQLIGKGVHYCAHCDGRFYKDKTVAVVGGGNTAVEDALYLSRIAKKVYLIHRRDTLRATRVYHDPLMSAENIEILKNKTPVALLSGERLEGVRLRDTADGSESELSVDALFVAIGRIPVTGFLPGEILLEDGYIKAGESTETTALGVFAAGDVRTKSLRQVITAAADGAMAADAAEKYLFDI